MTDFDPAHLPQPHTDLDRLRADLDLHGYCLVERALDREMLKRVLGRLQEQAQAERERSIAYANPGHLDNQWVNMLINKGEVFHGLVTHPVTSALVRHLLGRDYLLSCCDAQIKNPGADTMPMHTDQWWMPPPVAAGGDHTRPADMARIDGDALVPAPVAPFVAPPAVCNVMWMLSDFTAHNGATCVVPGSHRSGLQPDQALPHPMQSVPATGEAGTAIVFDGRLWHSAGRNTTNATRYGITTAFCGPQFRSLENYTLGLRPEVRAHCSPEMLRLLGFKAWSTYGHTGDPGLDCAAPGADAVGELHG